MSGWKKAIIFWAIILSIVGFLVMLGLNRTIAGEKWHPPDSAFKESLTIQQVVKEFPWLTYVREFEGADKTMRWLFKYTTSPEMSAKLHQAPVIVNVGENPSKAEVNIAGIAALCEAYAIAEWVESLHEASPSPSPTPTPKGFKKDI